MKRGLCRFCDQDSDLIDAHIIPKAIFKRVRGNGPALKELNTWKGDAGNKSKGFVDPELICGPCDNKFSDAEHYFADYLEQHYNDAGCAFDDITAFIDDTFDYRKFKIALLATLWRANETSEEHFVNVRLSDKAASKLKTNLEKGEPGSKSDFTVYVRRLYSEKYAADLAQAILDPVTSGENTVEFVMLGWQFLICFSEDCSSSKFGNLPLEPGRLVAIDAQIEGTPEEAELIQILAAADFAPKDSSE